MTQVSKMMTMICYDVALNPYTGIIITFMLGGAA